LLRIPDNEEYTYDTGVAAVTEVSVSAAAAGVGVGAAGVAAVAGTSTFFQSAPGSTINAINSPTAMPGEFSGFCTTQITDLFGPPCILYTYLLIHVMSFHIRATNIL